MFLSICNVHFHIYLHLSMVVICGSFVYTWFENYQFLLIHGKYTHNIKIEYKTYIHLYHYLCLWHSFVLKEKSRVVMLRLKENPCAFCTKVYADFTIAPVL